MVEVVLLVSTEVVVIVDDKCTFIAYKSTAVVVFDVKMIFLVVE